MTYWKPGTAKPLPADVVTSAEKPLLSKSVMGMKFMQRKEEIKLQQEIRQTLDQLDGTNWNAELNEEVTISKETSDLHASLPGRRSFGGFNKVVERHYQQMIDDQRFAKATAKDNKNTISDEEMLLRYEKLIGLPRGPSQGMRPDMGNNKKVPQKEVKRKNADNPFMTNKKTKV